MTDVSNRVRRLLDEGQSIWLDFISRDLIGSGRLARLIDEERLRGMTSNPSIFEKAVSTVNTLPESTYEAFKDHGVVERTIDKDLEAADSLMKALAGVGIDVDAATAKLQVDGVEVFVKSFDKVVGIAEQRLLALAA